jgi:radical SAM protein with 4Fe4S-binding SPASM domain
MAYPSTIMVELTSHCQLACTICPREYAYGKAMDKGTMTVEQAKKIIGEVSPYLDSIGLTGMGETFLYNNLAEIAHYIKSKNRGIIISLSTNAVVPCFIEKVTPVIGVVDTIQISIDGINEVYESIRINSNFKALDENLKQLVEITRGTSTDLMLNMVVTKENYTHIPNLVEYAGSMGIRYLDFTLLNLASVTEIDRGYYKFYSSPEFLAVLEKLEITLKKYPNVTVTNRNFTTENNFQKCPFPWSHFYICWNGFVTPCCAKPFPKELNFGNVFEDGVLKVLNSRSFRKFRTLWYKNQAPDFCEKCHFLDIEPVR